MNDPTKLIGRRRTLPGDPKYVQRQVTVIPVVPMKKPTLLIPIDKIIGGIDIKPLPWVR